MKYQLQIGTILIVLLYTFNANAENLTLTGDLAAGTYEVYGKLLTEGETTIQADRNVTFNATSSTHLSSGFILKKGSVFKIKPLAFTIPEDSGFAFGADQMNLDSDGDGLSNLMEYYFKTDPDDPDFDSILDIDNDGMPDEWEIMKFGFINTQDASSILAEYGGVTALQLYLDFYDYLHMLAIIYFEGDQVESKIINGLEIHSRNITTIKENTALTLTKQAYVKLFPGFSVEKGGSLAVESIINERIILAVSPPKAPTYLRVSIHNNIPKLIWVQNTESDLAGYKVYRNGADISPNATIMTQTTFTDNSVSASDVSTYSYHITAVDKTGKESGPSNIVTITQDKTAPTIFSTYPSATETFYTDGEPVSMIATFQDVGASGIASVILLDENDVDVTANATIYNNSLEYVIKDPVSGIYIFKLTVNDGAGNTTTEDITFTVDTTILKTTVDKEGGVYIDNPVIVTLTSSVAGSTIYYSTDDYDQNAGQTQQNLQTCLPNETPCIVSISNNSLLRFYSVDPTGRIEVEKSMVYVLDEVLPSVSPLTIAYIHNNTQATLSWNVADANDPGETYEVYRCDNGVDCKRLKDSHIGKYKPSSFQSSVGPLSTTSYTDTGLPPGTTFKYAVISISSEGVYGQLSELVSITIENDGKAPTIAETLVRAKGWLKSQQDAQGAWGEGDEKFYATDQALHALKPPGTTTPDHITRGVYFLRGYPADNNDYLARKVATLLLYNQNADEAASRLLTKQDTTVQDGQGRMAWGLSPLYAYDPLDTILAVSAIKQWHSTPPLVDPDKMINMTGIVLADGVVDGKYSLISYKKESIFVSSFAHNILSAHHNVPAEIIDPAWIYASQRDATVADLEGSFGNGIIDTAGVLLYLNPDQIVRDKAISFLRSLQDPNGSWGNDIYLTALCLEAITRGSSL